jgi:nitrile hydratase beta subunit
VNGIHDLGGMHGFGPVEREQDEPVFHADWERVVYAIQRARTALDLFNIDEMRHGIERMPPLQYLAASYYERWLATIELNLVEKGILSPEEIEARTAYFRDQPGAEVPRRDDPALVERVASTLRANPHFDRELARPPRFREGDHVVTHHFQPRGHTRLPRYARGKRGIIDRVRGGYVFPDTSAHGAGEQPQPVYSVCFESAELWADSAEPRASVYLDLWESYLEPA